MKQRLTLMSGLLVVLLIGDTAICRTEVDSRARSVLASVPALEKRLSYAEPKIPLKSIVDKVATATGVKLVAARDVADEPVTVAVSDFPAVRLLDELAELLGYRWARAGREGAWRYEIYQDLDSKQQEEAARQASLRDVERRLREELVVLAKVAALPEEEFRALRQAAEGYDARQQRVSAERLQLLAAAGTLSSPVLRQMAGLLVALSPQQWDVLRRGRVLSFFTDARRDEPPLSDEMSVALRAYRPGMDEGARRRMERAAPAWRETLQKAVEHDGALWAAAMRHRVTICLRSHGRQYRAGGSLCLEVRALPVVSEIPDGNPYFGGDRGSQMILSAGAVDPRQTGQAVSEERRAALGRDPVLGARKVFRPKLRSRPRPGWTGDSSIWRLPELLPELARVYGVDILADAYWDAPSVPVWKATALEPTALFSMLDRLAGSHYHWDRRGRLIHLRSRTWFIDRPREIPMHLVVRWQELCRRYGALPLEEYVQGVARLSDAQLESLTDLTEEASFPPELETVRKAHYSRRALRLYGALTYTQRDQLWRGKGIPASAMTPGQLRLFMAQWQDPDAVLAVLLAAADLSGAVFSLERTPCWLVRESRGDETLRYEFPSRTSGAPGVSRSSEADVRRGTESVVPTRGGGRTTGTPGHPSERVDRFPAMLLKFNFRLGPYLNESVAVTVPATRDAAARRPQPEN